MATTWCSTKKTSEEDPHLHHPETRHIQSTPKIATEVKVHVDVDTATDKHLHEIPTKLTIVLANPAEKNLMTVAGIGKYLKIATMS